MSYEKLSQFVIYMRWMQERDLDVLTITSSPKGFGKSSFIIQAAINYMKTFGLQCSDCQHEWVYTDKAIIPGQELKIKEKLHQSCPKCHSNNVGTPKRFNFEKYLAYDNDEVREKVFELPEYCPILADEGVRFMMGEDWMTTESKTMKKLFAQMRTKHLLVFANIPRFRWIDSKYRNDMTTFWVRIMFRSFALLMQPDLGEAKDPWHLKELEEKMGKYHYFTSEEQLQKIASKLIHKHPCCFDFFRFPKVPEDIYQQYLKARNKKAFERKNKDEGKIDQKELAKIMAYNLMNRWGELQGAIKAGRFDRPTLKIFEKFICFDPKTEEPLVAHTTVRNWLKEIDQIVKK